MNIHQKFMHRALQLAEKGGLQVAPNPKVGCVLVKHGRIVGEGYHARYGGPHAEILALRRAGAKAKGATAYVTLEPCSHFGKTPPCAPRLIQSGIKEVFVASKDPHPSVSGDGIRLFKSANVPIYVGFKSKDAKTLNRDFFKRVHQNRPYVVLKFAMTLDGKIATANGDSKWITSTKARSLTRTWRSQFDGIIVGRRTIETDNPRLTSTNRSRTPVRLILDPNGRIKKTVRVFNDGLAPTWVFIGPKGKLPNRHPSQNNPQYIKCPQKRSSLDLKFIMKYLLKNNVNKVLLEGGSKTSWSFIKAGLVDEIWAFLAPKILGGQENLGPIGGEGFSRIAKALPLKFETMDRIGSDVLIRARLARS